MSLTNRLALRCPLAAGALLAVSPAFGATFDLALTRNDYALGALLLVLVIALGVSLSRDRSNPSSDDAMREEPDMRWWKNAHM